MVSLYFRNADGVMIVYDVTNEKSFSNVKNWYNLVSQQLKRTSIGIVANKSDCDDKSKKIKRENGIKLSKELKASFFEVSAKSGKDIENAFIELAKTFRPKEHSTSPRLLGNDEVNQDNKVCCTLL